LEHTWQLGLFIHNTIHGLINKIQNELTLMHSPFKELFEYDKIINSLKTISFIAVLSKETTLPETIQHQVLSGAVRVI